MTIDEGSVELPTRRDRRRRPRTGATVARLVGNGLSAGALILVVGIALAAIVVPMLIGGRSLAVLTPSMEPGYPAGSLIVVAPTEPRDVRIGDVLTFQLKSGESTLVTHRVIEIGNVLDGSRVFTTKGDANDIADADQVQEVQVVGTVIYMVPWLGWVSTAVNGDLRQFIVPAIVAALLVYAAWMAMSSIRDKARKRDAEDARAADPARAQP